MRRPLSLVILAHVLSTVPVAAQTNIPSHAAAVVIIRSAFASPMRTYEQAASTAFSEGGAIIETGDHDAPYVVVTTDLVMVCVSAGQRASDLVSDYMRQRNRTRPYLAERFDNSRAAELVRDRMQSAEVISDAWIVQARDGSAVLVYRNPLL